MKLQEQDVVIDKVQAITQRIEELNKPDLSLEKSYEVLEDLMVRLHNY